ncbi:MAG: hypothetical protein WAU77_02780 [Solirubrobacteraceae bacterium]
MLGVVHIAPGTFFAIIAASAVAASIATVAVGRGLVVPVVITELLLGIVLGPRCSRRSSSPASLCDYAATWKPRLTRPPQATKIRALPPRARSTEP